MDYAGAGLFGHRSRQPFDQFFNLGNRLGLGHPIEFGPGMDLALEIIARLAVPFEADFLVIEIVQAGERADHRA